MLLVIAVLCCVPVSGEAALRRVLIINSFGNSFAPFSTISGDFRTELARQSPDPVEFYESLLEIARSGEPEIERAYVAYLQALLTRRDFDLVVPVGGPAFQLWMKYRDSLLPDAPVIIAGMEHRLIDGAQLRANEIFVGNKTDTSSPVRNILRLLPGTKTIAVIVGDSPIERYWLGQIRREFKAFEDRVRFEWLSDLSAEDMLKRAKTLPPGSVLLYGMLMMDRAGIPNEQDQLLDRIASEVNLPVFGYFENQLGRGIVGGDLVPVRKMGVEMARVAVRILAGDPPGGISFTHTEPVSIYDWRELRRWGISESRLPPGSEIRFRPASIWSQYHWHLLAGAVIFIVQAGAITGLLVHRARGRRMSAALAEEGERMRLAADAARLGVWVWNVSDGGIWMSEEGRQLFGFGPSERIDIEGMTAALHPDDRTTFRRSLAKSREGESGPDGQYRVARPGASAQWLDMRHRMEFNAEGNLALVRGVCLDATDRRASEMELEQLRGQISHVGRVSVMGQLASALAHELNQPLGAILSNTDAATLFLQNDPPDLDEVRAILDDIRKDDKRAGDVIARMRRLLKRRELEFGPVDVAELIEQAVTLLRPDAMTRRVALEERIDDGLPLVRGDWVHLQQVLLNLMVNGMDAMEGRPVRERLLTITARPAAEDGVEISVIDTGPGIPRDRLRQVFDEFYSTKPDGMGMGLPISRTIVEAHGGRIWAETADAGGAEFRFTLQPL